MWKIIIGFWFGFWIGFTAGAAAAETPSTFSYQGTGAKAAYALEKAKIVKCGATHRELAFKTIAAHPEWGSDTFAAAIVNIQQVMLKAGCTNGGQK